MRVVWAFCTKRKKEAARASPRAARDIPFPSGKKRKSTGVPAACKNEAKKLLAGRRVTDWGKAMTKIDFEETDIIITSGDSREVIPYAQIAEVFESEHLWLLMYHDERALLLQKKDLVSGDAAMFTSHILQETASFVTHVSST